MTIFESLLFRGLNKYTGISPEITVEKIEEDTGKRIVGNGSTIRRDTKPYSFFNMEKIKERGRVIAFLFSGYKTRRDLIGELTHMNEASQKRIEDETKMIKDRTSKIAKLSAAGELEDVMFTYLDI